MRGETFGGANKWKTEKQIKKKHGCKCNKKLIYRL